MPRPRCVPCSSTGVTGSVRPPAKLGPMPTREASRDHKQLRRRSASPAGVHSAGEVAPANVPASPIFRARPAACARNGGRPSRRPRARVINPEVICTASPPAPSACRACLTESEARLWSAIQARQLGVSFRRQVPVAARFNRDFCAPSTRRDGRGCFTHGRFGFVLVDLSRGETQRRDSAIMWLACAADTARVYRTINWRSYSPRFKRARTVAVKRVASFVTSGNVRRAPETDCDVVGTRGSLSRPLRPVASLRHCANNL